MWKVLISLSETVHFFYFKLSKNNFMYINPARHEELPTAGANKLGKKTKTDKKLLKGQMNLFYLNCDDRFLQW